MLETGIKMRKELEDALKEEIEYIVASTTEIKSLICSRRIIRSATKKKI